MFWKLFVSLGLVVFVLLSVTDWVFTFTLLQTHPEAIETNPFAAACLEQHGWTGLAVYKLGGVLVFVGAIYLLFRRRPVVASGVVALGCAVLLSVTTYTHRLICDVRRNAAENAYLTAPVKRPVTTGHNANNLPVPERCWFAPDSPAQTVPNFATTSRE